MAVHVGPGCHIAETICHEGCQLARLVPRIDRKRIRWEREVWQHDLYSTPESCEEYGINQDPAAKICGKGHGAILAITGAYHIASDTLGSNIIQ